MASNPNNDTVIPDKETSTQDRETSTVNRANAKPSDSHVVSIDPLDPNDAKWTKLMMVTYIDPLERKRTYESAERKTRHEGSLIDGVGVIAVLKHEDGPQILLQKQFRPPTGKVCIEIPAGLLDEKETGEAAAVRELREETGYIGTAVPVAGGGGGGEEARGIMFNDPGFTNTNLVLVHVDIDLSLPKNQPGQVEKNKKPEDDEFIETFSVPLTELWNECRRLEAEGCAIDARVGTLAEGIEMARKWGIK